MSLQQHNPNIVCLGVSHHTAPVDVRERFAIAPSRLDEAAARFKRIEGVGELVILSTCNRVEFYAAGDGLASGYEAFDHFFREHAGLGGDGLAALYRYDFPHSVEHLFRVASGLDSMVMGETEITGQVKQAYQQASCGGHTSRYLNRLFQKAFQAAKQVRTRTGINRGAISVGSVAVDLAGRIFGELSSCRVMVVGAGENSERTARSLVSRGVRDVLVANRSTERALALAESMSGRAVPLAQWESQVPATDILIASTAAPHYIIDKAKLAPRLDHRGDRPLFLIDIAVPRDVAPDVNDLDGVYLYDIDSLQAIADNSLRERRLQAGQCEAIVREQAREFSEWFGSARRRLQRPSATGGGGLVSSEAGA